MPLVESPIILVCVGLYLLICLAVGAWAMRRTHTIADFLIAGRSLGLIVVVLATMSSIMSGFGFVGGPGLVYEAGISSLWMTFPATFGMPLIWVMVGKRLSLLGSAREILTLPDVVQARYGGRWPRFFMALAILLGVLGYLGTQILAIGAVLVAVLNIDLIPALAIGLSVLAFYTVAGGMIASVYTDLFQGMLMLVASLAVTYYSINAAGGMSAISHTLWHMDPAFIGPWGTRGPLTALSWYLLFTLGAVGQPHGITKLLMLRDIHALRWGALLTGCCYALLSLLWMSLGLAMRTLVETGRHAPLESPDLAAPVFLLNYTPELLAGVVFAGLLAAIMSTADSFLNIGAAAVVHDIPTALRGRPLARQLMWSRVATAVLLVASALFALYMENLIALLGTFGWGTFAAAIVPSVALGLNWKRATAAACVASISVSLVLNFALELANRHNLYTLPYGMNVGCFSLLVSLIAFVTISLLSRDSTGTQIAPDVRAAMEV
jgi:sodium/proline symporter